MFSKMQYVYTLYQEGSFTRAAEKLFISQPSLSVAIQNVEKKLGAALFERTGTGVRLTEVGQAYIAAAEKIINIEKEFKSQVNDIRYLESGRLTVGGSNYISSYVLPRIINTFTARYPKISVSLVEANSHNLHQLLHSGQVDIILDNLENTEEYKGYPLREENILLCVPENSAVNTGLEGYRIDPDRIYDGTLDFDKVECVPLNVFQKEKFILLKPENDMHHRAMALFQDSDIQPQVAFYVDQLNISYALTDSGLGVSFVTDTLFQHRRFRENVALYCVQRKSSRTLYLAHMQNKYCSRAMAEFIQAAKAVIR